MNIQTLREQMSVLINKRNELIEKMKYHNTEALEAKNEANSLNVKIEDVNSKIANQR